MQQFEIDFNKEQQKVTNTCNHKILFVDDEPNILSSYQRTMRKYFNIITAQSGFDGLKIIEESSPIAVVISDMKMPEMDGIEFLSKVKDKSPDSVRIMLTGFADIDSAIRVVNESNIFRFLTKPCDPTFLIKAIKDGINQYELIIAERELLNKTLSGSIKSLIDIIEMVEPQAFSKAQSLRENIQIITKKLGSPYTWELHLAAMLAQIGMVTVPQEVIIKARNGYTLSQIEQEMLERVPEIGARILNNIPRLENVAKIVLYQNKNYDGSGFPKDNISGDNIPLGARIIKVLNDLFALETSKIPRTEAFKIMSNRHGWYDPKVLSAASACFSGLVSIETTVTQPIISVSINNLKPGYILRSNIETKDGILIASAGFKLTPMAVEKIQNFSKINKLKEPILVEAEPVSQKPNV